MEFDNLLLEIHENIATVTVNRPQALNALNEATLQELLCCFEGLEIDPEVKVVILTGAGEKAFVAGADIAAMQAMDALAARRFALLGQQAMNRIEQLSKPVIAAVNGFALGGGCELALACDIRLAADHARFGQPEVNLGVIPGFAGTQRLPRLIGKGRAKELLFTGDMIDAAEACRLGLANRVVPRAELAAAARELAGKHRRQGGARHRPVQGRGRQRPGDGDRQGLPLRGRPVRPLFCHRRPERGDGGVSREAAGPFPELLREEPMHLELTEEQKLIQETARDFAAAELAPIAADLDRGGDREPFYANLQKLAELGFMGLNVREEYGGAEAGVVAFSVAMTEIARACAATAVTVSVNNMVCEVIQAIGSEAQKQAYIPRICSGEYRAGAFALTEPGAGSDPAGMTTTARARRRRLGPQRRQDLHHQRPLRRGLRGLGGDRQGRAQGEGDQLLSGRGRHSRPGASARPRRRWGSTPRRPTRCSSTTAASPARP